MKRKDVVKIIDQGIANAEALLIEGGSVRIGLTDKERKVMSHVILEDLEERGLRVLTPVVVDK